MKLSRILVAVMALAVLVALAGIAQQTAGRGERMVAAAQKFLDSLGAEQKAKGVFDFDSKERTYWNFVPMQDKQKKPTRKGVGLFEMTPEQKKLAVDLVAAGTSPVGKDKALTVMSLEAILHELESKRPNNVRDPEWYFFTVFGTPSKTGKWGFRVEGHHLSLNLTLNGTQVLAATPCFYGANPATVQSGPKKGLRTLPGAEDQARALFKSLTPEQKQLAYQAKQLAEIEQRKATPEVKEAIGLPAAKMTKQQQALLVKLLEDYTSRMPEEIGAAEMKAVRTAGLDNIHFAYAGGSEPGQPYTYRVHGPSFVVMFLNVQPDSGGNPANHIHSVWRRMKGDFGL